MAFFRRKKSEPPASNNLPPAPPEPEGPDPRPGVLADLQNLIPGSVLEGGDLYLPDGHIRVRLVRADVTKAAILEYLVDSPDWDRAMREISAGLGPDPGSAVHSANTGLVHGLLSAVTEMTTESVHHTHVETQFQGTHLWTVYFADQVTLTLTKHPAEVFAADLWDLVKDGVLERLGNQRLVYVKLYAAHMVDSVVGECRINDIPIQELGDKLATVVDAWPADAQGSLKQFCVLLQEAGSWEPYPLTEQAIRGHVRAVLDLVETWDGEEDLDDLVAALVPHPDLAQEIRHWLPELAASAFYPSIDTGEKLHIARGDAEPDAWYQTQSATYHVIANELWAEAEKPERLEALRVLAALSALHNVVQQAKAQGADIDQPGSTMATVYHFSDDYVFR
jgi:hypothetical protein